MIYFLEDRILALCFPSILILLLSIFYSFWGNQDQNGTFVESSTGFECGFDSLIHMSVGFCIRFFNLAILFLFVDLEIAFLIPFYGGGHFSNISPLTHCQGVLSIFTVLFFILFIEKVWGGLSWSEEI